MALSRAHLAEENRTHFPLASMFACSLFLVFVSRDAGEVSLVLRGVCTGAGFSGGTGRAAPSAFLLTERMQGSCGRYRKHFRPASLRYISKIIM